MIGNQSLVKSFLKIGNKKEIKKPPSPSEVSEILPKKNGGWDTYMDYDDNFFLT